MSRIPKDVGPGGTMSGLVPYTRKRTPLKNRYANCPEFDLGKWRRRFKSLSTSHVDRLGMLRSIPDMELSAQQIVLILRDVILDWADGFPDSVRQDPTGHLSGWSMFLKVRQEVWIMLSRLLKEYSEEEKAEELMRVDGFLEDMAAFFTPLASWERPVSNLENPFRRLERQNFWRLAGEGVREILESFIRMQFSYSWKQVLPDTRAGGDPDSKARKEEVRRWTIFSMLAGIDPGMLDCLPYDRCQFEMIVSRVCIASGTDSLEQIPQPKREVRQHPDWYAVARKLMVIACKLHWQRIPGVLDTIR